MNLRFAEVKDAQAILDIYAQYIDKSVTFEWPLPTLSEFEERIRGIISFYPYLVAEEDGHIIGYAYAHRAQERAAYSWNSEFSVYIDSRCTKRGLGRLLYTKLLELSALQGIHNVYGVVTIPNDASFALHQSLGFHVAAHLTNAGYKAGKWHDVIWFEKRLIPHSDPPEPVKPFPTIDRKTAENIINKL